MPRTSRHKSSKPSSREARDCSDSDKDSSLKEKIAKEYSVSGRSSKEMTSGEKRKVDPKSIDGRDLVGSGSGEHGSSSRKRKEKVEDDRWTGGGDDDREVLKTEVNLKDSKAVAELKSRSNRREENFGLRVDAEEGGGKRNGSKGDQKHHRLSDRKDKSEKEVCSERERKGKDGNRSERFVDIDGGIDIIGSEGSRKVGLEDEHSTKNVAGNNGSSARDEFHKHEDEREHERRVRRKRDSSGDGDKQHRDGVREIDGQRPSSRDDVAKSGRYKDEVHKDKYREDAEKESRHQEEKQRVGRHARDYTISRSDDKYLRNEKRDSDTQQKKSKRLDGEHDSDRSGRHHFDRHDHDRELDDRDNDLDRDRDRDQEQGHDRGRDRDLDREHDRDHRYRHERERDRFRERDFTHDRSRDWEHDDRDYSSHIDDRSSRYKEDRRRRRSPDEYDDYYNDKSRSAKREGDVDRCLSRKGHADAITGSSRGRASPSSKSHISIDKFRDAAYEDAKYGDSVKELASISETRDRNSKCRPIDKRCKFDDNRLGDLSAEKSPGTKTSPMGVMERSPSSTSIDRKYVNRTGRRQSLDIDESDRRSSGSNDVRDGYVNEDRLSRDLSLKRYFGEEHFQVESLSYHRSGQGAASSHASGPHGFRAGADSPSFMGSMGEEGRVHSNSRYRRSVDPNIGRMHGTPWKGVPNWPSPLPNGFMPFPPGPHGPPHGGFPGVIPQFPSPSIFGVRPVEMTHPGIPYMSDPERFSNHVRPLGWQNTVDGTGPSHFHGWDANGGVSRDDSSIYDPGHQSNGHGQGTIPDTWKQNVDINSSVPPGSEKDGHMMKASRDEAFSVQDAEGSNCDSNYPADPGKNVKTKTNFDSSPAKDAPFSPAKVTAQKAPESSPEDDAAYFLHVYLSKLDISIELLPPALCSQCKNLTAEGQIEDDSDEITACIPLEENASMGLEVLSPVMDVTVLHAAEDSVFERAMDLYKTCSRKRSSQVSDGKTLHVSSASEKDGEKEILVQDGEVKKNELVHMSDQEIQEPSVTAFGPNAGLFSISTQKELEGPVSPLEVEASEDHPNAPEMVVSTIDLAESGRPVLFLAGDKMEDDTEMEKRDSEEPPPVNAEEAHDSSAEIVHQNVITKDTAESNMYIVGENRCSESSSYVEPQQVGGTVSGSLILPNGPVNVCEALLSVSNESESVILTRIHPAPESTR